MRKEWEGEECASLLDDNIRESAVKGHMRLTLKLDFSECCEHFDHDRYFLGGITICLRWDFYEVIIRI